MFKMLPVIIFAVWLLMIAAIVATAYYAATIQPEEVGAFVGRIVHGFKEAA